MRKIIIRRFKYNSGKVRIKSRISLTDEEVTAIIAIVNEVMDMGYYEPCYDIARKIFHRLKYRKLRSVETDLRERKFIVKLA